METIKEHLSDVFFYSLEKSIKTYRQFAQRRLVQQGFNVTIDQWLLLKALAENPEQTQHEIADAIFKDYASITRMIDLLVKKKYLQRDVHPTDRRRYRLALSEEGIKLINALQPVIERNRSIALQNITTKQSSEVQQILHLIIKNCQL